jgi:hypothetical protein
VEDNLGGGGGGVAWCVMMVFQFVVVAMVGVMTAM